MSVNTQTSMMRSMQHQVLYNWHISVKAIAHEHHCHLPHTTVYHWQPTFSVCAAHCLLCIFTGDLYRKAHLLSRSFHWQHVQAHERWQRLSFLILQWLIFTYLPLLAGCTDESASGWWYHCTALYLIHYQFLSVMPLCATFYRQVRPGRHLAYL